MALRELLARLGPLGKPWVLGALALGLVAAAALAAPLFLPKASTNVDQAAPSAGEVRLQGAFAGAGDGVHHARGQVQWLDTPQGPVLRFTGYDATAGPDVYFYLTEAPDARTRAQVEGGVRVPVPGGDADGQATLRGNFNVPLPQGLDPARFRGLAVWCDRFDTLFGGAALAPA